MSIQREGGRGWSQSECKRCKKLEGLMLYNGECCVVRVTSTQPLKK